MLKKPECLHPFLKPENYQHFDFEERDGFTTIKAQQFATFHTGLHVSDSILWLQYSKDASEAQKLKLIQRMCNHILVCVLTDQKRIPNSLKCRDPTAYLRILCDDYDMIDSDENRIRCAFQFKLPFKSNKTDAVKLLKGNFDFMKGMATMQECANHDQPIRIEDFPL